MQAMHLSQPCSRHRLPAGSLKLQQLKPRGNFKDAELQRFLHQHPHISRLSMLLTDKKAVAVCRDIPQITCLYLCPSRKEPQLDVLMSWPRQLKSLTKWSTLKELHLYSCTSPSFYNHLSSLSALTGLCSLNIHDSGFSYGETRWLSVLQSLTCLQMAHCPSAECARALSCLKYLCVEDGVTEGQAKSLSRLTRLDWRCQKHTAPQSCMRNVQSMQGLKHFYYEGSSIYGLEHFSSLTRLTTLHLCETWVVHNYAEDADRLSTLTALHDLNIRYSVQLEIPGPIQTMQLIRVNHTSGPHVSIVRVA